MKIARNSSSFIRLSLIAHVSYPEWLGGERLLPGRRNIRAVCILFKDFVEYGIGARAADALVAEARGIGRRIGAILSHPFFDGINALALNRIEQHFHTKGRASILGYLACCKQIRQLE